MPMRYSIEQNGFELATAQTELEAFEKATKLGYLFLNVKIRKVKRADANCI